MINYFLLGFRNLKRRGIRSWLTLLGIVIGIMTVVSLITLGNGLQDAVGSQFGVASTQVITVQAGGLTGYGPPGTGVSNPLKRSDAEAIEKLTEVEVAIPRNIVPLPEVEYRRVVISGLGVSFPDEREKISLGIELMDMQIEEGRFIRENDYKKIVIGYNFFEDSLSPFGIKVTPGERIIIDEENFEVIGIIEKQGSFIFDNTIFIKDSELKNIGGYGNDVDLIAVKVRDSNKMDLAKEKIEELMRDRRNVKKGEEDFKVETPEATLSQVNDILAAVQAFIIIIASISIFVGAIGIVNTMTTSVLERVREIGIMKAVGAKNKHIFFQFLIESGMLGFIGGVIGTILGMMIGYTGIWGINNLIGVETKLKLDFFLIGFVLVGSFLIGAISGISPALNAAKKDPIESLRN